MGNQSLFILVLGKCINQVLEIVNNGHDNSVLRPGIVVSFVEDSTNHGRLDMTLKFNSQVYLFEFKVVELSPKGNALQQIKDKHYADKYRSVNQPIYMIGVEFNKTDRNIVGFEVEQV